MKTESTLRKEVSELNSKEKLSQGQKVKLNTLIDVLQLKVVRKYTKTLEG